MVVCLRVNTGVDIETGATKDLSADGIMSLDQHIVRFQLPGCHLCMRILQVNTAVDIETNAPKDLSTYHVMYFKGNCNSKCLALRLLSCTMSPPSTQVNTGVDIETGAPKDLSTDGIMDLYATKWWAVKLATDAVITVLKVDQIIMAKQVSPAAPVLSQALGAVAL